MTDALSDEADATTRAYSIARYRASSVLMASLLALSLAGCASQSLRNSRQHFADHPARGSQGRMIESGADGLSRRRGRGRRGREGETAVLQNALEHYYRQWAGTPYRYGGQSSQGIDCSSFVRHALSAVDSYRLPRTAAAQARTGHRIAPRDLSAGDLVFFKTGRLSRHVGIYIGDGRFMHASSSDGVTISRLGNIYWRHHYWQSRRLPLTGVETALR